MNQDEKPIGDVIREMDVAHEEGVAATAEESKVKEGAAYAAAIERGMPPAMYADFADNLMREKLHAEVLVQSVRDGEIVTLAIQLFEGGEVRWAESPTPERPETND